MSKNMKIEYSNKDYSISFTRFIAMIFIILCHILQYYKIELCWWFNVGVQVFFIISGWLYFNRKFNSIQDVIKFYIKNALKLLTNYYVYISLLFLFFISIKKIPNGFMNLFDLSGTVSGLGHLWFIKYILICYLLVPIFTKIIKFCKKKRLNIFSIIFVPIIIALLCKQFNIIGAWINCFYFGMILHAINEYNYQKYLTKVIYIIAIILNVVQIYLQYILNLDLLSIKNGHYLCEYAHAFLGLLCFYLLKHLYEHIIKDKISVNLLELSDKYSYDVYLTHHIYILGTYSFFNNSSNIILNLIKLILTICISTYILNQISLQIKNALIRVLKIRTAVESNLPKSL